MHILQFIFLLLWVGIIKIFCSQSIQRKPYQIESVNYDVDQIRCRWGVALLAILPLVFITTYRNVNFGDTEAYISTFKNMSTSLQDAFSILTSNNTKDKGFYFLVAILKCIIKDNNLYHIYLFVLAAFQAIAVASLFKKYSEDFAFSFFLFITSLDYISWMFNGIRQFTAVSIILLFTSFIIRRKYIIFIPAILLASTMHQSALIMIPIVLVCLGKAFNKRTTIFMILALLAVAFVGQFTELMDFSLSSTQYVNVVSDYTGFDDDGTSFIRVLIYSIPAVIAIYGRKKIQESDDAVINFCTNMSIVSAGIYLVSMFTSGIFLGRLPIYCSLYNYVLLPWEIKHLFNEKKQQTMWTISIFLYVCLYLMQIYQYIMSGF